MTKASELREMSDEQLSLTLKEAADNAVSACGSKPRPSGWTPRANFAT